MKLDKLIERIRNTRDIENLKERLGKELGSYLYQLIDRTEKADKELNIIHECITDLYQNDSNIPRIRKALDDINHLNN